MDTPAANELIRTVQQFYDLALEHARGGFGAGRMTCRPLFANAVYHDDEQGVVPFAEVDGEIYCNVALHGSLFRGLVSLSNLTEDGAYRRAAEDAMRFFMERYQSPASGLLVWGGHAAITLRNGLPSLMNNYMDHWAHHELKCHQLFYDLMESVAPEATARFVRGFWNAHTRETKDGFEFNRHGDLFGILSEEGKRQLLKGGGRCQFITTALDLACGAVHLHHVTGDAAWLARTKKMIRRFDETRDPNTGLGQTSWSLENQPKIMERHCLGRYTTCATAALRLAELMDEDGEIFKQTVLNDLLAFGRYCFDEVANGYYIRRDMTSGKRVDNYAREAVATSAYKTNGLAEIKNASLPAVFYAFALGLRVTGETELMETVDRTLALLDMEKDFDFALQGSESGALLIQGLLELHQANGDGQWLSLAKKVAKTCLERFVTPDGWFKDWRDTRIYRLGQRLPLALLRLAAVERGGTEKVEPDPGGGQYVDVDPRIRFRFNRHTYRLRNGNAECVIGDHYPHDSLPDGFWDYAGAHAVIFDPNGRNVFAPSLGGMIPDIIRDFVRCADLLSGSAVLFEAAKMLPTDGGETIPVMTRALYALTAPDTLDLTLWMATLECDGHDTLPVGCESHFPANSTVEIVEGIPAFLIHANAASVLLCADRAPTASLTPDDKTNTALARFQWNTPATTGRRHVLRVRLQRLAPGDDPRAAYASFAGAEPPDVEEMIHASLASDIDITSN